MIDFFHIAGTAMILFYFSDITTGPNFHCYGRVLIEPIPLVYNIHIHGIYYETPAFLHKIV